MTYTSIIVYNELCSKENVDEDTERINFYTSNVNYKINTVEYTMKILNKEFNKGLNTES